MTMYTHIYTVRGTDPFPLDMLRYDMSLPSRDRDVQEITHSINFPRGKERVVELVVGKMQKNWSPTVGRWQSFGWDVVEHEVR